MDDDTQFQMAEHHNKYDWEQLKAKYPNTVAFENRQVFVGVPLRTALFGLIAYLNAKGVNFFKTLSGTEVLKFNWKGKLAIIYAKSERELGNANPAGHDAIDCYLETLRKDKEHQEARKQKTFKKPMDSVTAFLTQDDLVKTMHVHASMLKEQGNAEVYSLMHEYLLIKANIAVFDFEYHIIDVYAQWLKEYRQAEQEAA